MAKVVRIHSTPEYGVIVNRATAEKLNPFIHGTTTDTLTQMADLLRDLGWTLAAGADSAALGGVRMPLDRMHLIHRSIAAALDYESAAVSVAEVAARKEGANG